MLFLVLYKVVLTFESVGEILKSHHSNANHEAFPELLPTFKCSLIFNSEIYELFQLCSSTESIPGGEGVAIPVTMLISTLVP